MHLYSKMEMIKYSKSTQGAVHQHICPAVTIFLTPMKSLDLFCAFSPQLFSLAVSLDSIRIDCALNEAMIKVHPIGEW